MAVCPKLQLEHTHLEALPQRLAEILRDLVHTDTAHSPDSKRSDEGVGVLAVLGEGVDGQDSEVWLRLCIVHEVKVDELLQLEVVSLHAVHHISKE